MDPRRILPYAFALTACAVIATVALLVVQRSPTPPHTEISTTSTAAAAPTGARAALAEWDARRADAWASGDVGALRGLYVAGSPSGREDVRMLSAYVDRGLHVTGLITQVLAWQVIEESDSALVVRVTDRIVGGVVTGGRSMTSLPRDRPTTYTVTMRPVDGEWLVWSVRDQASAATRTSRTSTSWKS